MAMTLEPSLQPEHCATLLLLPLCAPVVSGFLWFPAPGALGLGAVRCLLCWPSASRLSMRLSLFRAFRLAVGCSLVVAAPSPPPLFVLRFSSLLLGAVCRVLCCAVCPWVRCCAALLRVVSSGVVLSCAVLRSLGAAACCAVPCGAARRPGALCSAALCFAVFPRAVCSVLCVFCRGAVVRAVVRRSALCCVGGAVLCVPCPLRSVRCCASPCWCARVVLFVWCVLLLAPGAVVCRGAVLGLVARGCLLVACFGVGVPVWPRGLLPCGWCGLLWCPAFLCRVLWCCSCLLRSVRCGALLCWLWCPASLCRVLWRCAVVWCCAVVLCCRFAVLFVFALPSCGLSCGVSVVCAVVGASCCGVSLCVVVSPWAFCGVVVLLWCVVVSCCAVRCPVVSCALCPVLRCRAALRCCVGWLCCVVVCAAGVCFSFCPLFLC